MLKKYSLLAGTVGALLFTSPVHAVLVADGITYTLTEADIPGNALTDQFTLTITGINGAADTEKGRSGINAIAFNKPAGFINAAPNNGQGFTTVVGGLNSSGCDGSGNFFCFDNTAIPPTPGTPFAANSTVTFLFQVSTSNGDFTGYDPGFKIDWVGSKNNYDLVSKKIGINGATGGGDCPDCTPTPTGTDVPEPSSLAALATPVGALLIGGLVARRRRKVV